MIGHKTSLNKFKNTEIISGVFSNHNSIKLKINNRRRIRKFTNINIWKLDNMFLSNQWVKEENKKINKKRILKKTKLET